MFALSWNRRPGLSAVAKDGGGVLVRELSLDEERATEMRVCLATVRTARCAESLPDEGEVVCDVGVAIHEGSCWERIRGRYKARGWSVVEEIAAAGEWDG